MKTLNFIIAIILFATLLFSFSTHAYNINDFDDFIGYTIVAKKTIEGYVDEDGTRDDEFNGCDYDRVIIFTDNTILTCRRYRYSYAYRPKAIILSNGYNYKMIVGSYVYDMQR